MFSDPRIRMDVSQTGLKEIDGMREKQTDGVDFHTEAYVFPTLLQWRMVLVPVELRMCSV